MVSKSTALRPANWRNSNNGEGPAPTAKQIKEWRATLAVDFDGVIHAYSLGWQDGSCYDKLLEGAVPALKMLKQAGYRIVVFTSRNNLEAVEEWLVAWDVPFDEVTNHKVPALAYIDDRAVRFTNWADLSRLFA